MFMSISKTTRRRFVSLHRWLGLAAAAFWLVQAITGSLIVFHWEIRDATISRVERPLDLAGIEQRLAVLAPEGSAASVNQIWTSAGLPDRFEVYFTGVDGESTSVRIAGDGTMLRDVDQTGNAFIDLMVDIHHNLSFGGAGDWIVAISGMLLISNLIFGLVAAWPGRGTWRASLTPVSRGNFTARFYSWHRALGLAIVVPALLLVTTGTLMKFTDGLAGLTGAAPPALPANPSAPQSAGFAKVAQAALDTMPGSMIGSVSFPKPDDATYRISLRAPGDMRRAYGANLVLVNGNDASIRGSFPIAEQKAANRFMSALFPIHTGESIGLVGRFLVLALGLWLATMTIMGVLLWQRRRRR